MPDPLRVGVTYLPAETGIHWWQEFRPARAAHDLERIGAQGFREVRLHLAWDAFMPSHRQVDRHRLGELGGLLETARSLGMRCTPVLFAQSHGDCIQLPRYAVDRRRPRPGVRVLVDGRVESGGPRDLWADPLMLEAADRWLTGLLDAFATHPAIAEWDLGHDPATTLRPRRTAAMAAWVELMALAVRRRGDAVRLTLGAGDVLTARGVRPAAVAPHLDRLGLAVDPARLPIPGIEGPAGAAFTLQLAQRLAAADGRPAPPIAVVTGVAVDDDPSSPPPVAPPRTRPGGEPQPPHWDVLPLTPPVGATVTDTLLGRLCETGAAGLEAGAWCMGGPRTLGAPPWDRFPALGRHGLAAGDGELREHGTVWSALARREPAVQPAAPWPAVLDVEAYYAALPDSARDLHARWRADQEPERED